MALVFVSRNVQNNIVPYGFDLRKRLKTTGYKA